MLSPAFRKAYFSNNFMMHKLQGHEAKGSPTTVYAGLAEAKKRISPFYTSGEARTASPRWRKILSAHLAGCPVWWWGWFWLDGSQVVQTCSKAEMYLCANSFKIGVLENTPLYIKKSGGFFLKGCLSKTAKLPIIHTNNLHCQNIQGSPFCHLLETAF